MSVHAYPLPLFIETDRQRVIESLDRQIKKLKEERKKQRQILKRAKKR